MVRERETTFLLNSSVVGYDGIKRTLYLGGLECQTFYVPTRMPASDTLCPSCETE